jgi:hypothetical protein
MVDVYRSDWKIFRDRVDSLIIGGEAI